MKTIIEGSTSFETRIEVADRMVEFLIKTGDDLALSEYEVLVAVIRNLGHCSGSMRLEVDDVVRIFRAGYSAWERGEF